VEQNRDVARGSKEREVLDVKERDDPKEQNERIMSGVQQEQITNNPNQPPKLTESDNQNTKTVKQAKTTEPSYSPSLETKKSKMSKSSTTSKSSRLKSAPEPRFSADEGYTQPGTGVRPQIRAAYAEYMAEHPKRSPRVYETGG
jgi:hypothetical protein